MRRYSNQPSLTSLFEQLQASPPTIRVRPTSKRLKDRLSPADREAMVAARRAGRTIKDIAKEYEMSVNSARKILVSMG